MRVSISHIVKTGLLGALLSLCIITAPSVSAVEGSSIVMSPVAKPYDRAAGDVFQDSFKIINDGSEAYDFIVYSAPYSVNGRNYDPDYTTVRENTDAYTWIQFSQTKWHLEPGQNVDIPYTVRIPKDAAPGGHYGVLFAETQSRATGGTEVIRKKRVGSIIYATIKGTATIAGKTLAVSLPFYQPQAPLSSTLTVENSGNTDYTMSETMLVKDVFGAKKHEQKTDHIILPKTTRDIPIEWKNAPWVGLFSVTITSQVIGATTTSTSWVLIAPKWLLVAMVVVFVGGVYGLIRVRKRA